MKKYRLTVVLVLLLQFSFFGQDIHTTQVQQHDYLYNPGLIGNFKGNYRVNVSSRSQWSSINKAFQTYSFSTDGALFENKWKSGFLGLGLAANSDNSGSGFLKSNSVNLGVSGVVNLNSKNTLSLGFLSSFNQSSINPESISWGSQFNGISHDSNLPSYENFSTDQYSYFDFSTGLVWSYSKKERRMASYDETRFQLGVAAYHLTTPNLYSLMEQDQLYMRYVFYSSGFVGLNQTNVAIVPNLLVQVQGPNTEIIGGAYCRIRIKEASKVTGFVKESAISLGANYRHKDAISPGVFLEVSNYAIGISYDLNLSKLTPATNMKGGLEITLRFLNPSPFLYKSFKPSI